MKHVRIAAALMFLSVPGRALAQLAQTGQVKGQVVDTVGAAISGANVFVRRHGSTEDSIRLITHSDIHGSFVLILPQGGYDVLVTAAGFAAGVETIPVAARKTKAVEWQLKALDCDFPGVNCDTFQ